MPPKVVLIVPTYNGERWIKDTLEMIEKFTYPNLQVLVSDDCSTDGTWDIIDKFFFDRIVNDADNRLKWYIHKQEKNLGPWENFNWCVREISKEICPDENVIIACQDQDDTSAFDRIDHCVNVMLQNPKAGILSCSTATSGLTTVKLTARAYAPPIPTIMAWSWVYDKIGVRPDEPAGDVKWCKKAEREKIPWIAYDEVLYTHLVHKDQYSFDLYKDHLPKSRPLIALGVSTNEPIEPVAYHSHIMLHAAMMNDPRFDVGLVVVPNEAPIDRCRNMTIKDILKIKADYWMSIDADMIVQADACSRLYTTMMTYGAQVVSGRCRRRGWPYTSIWRAVGEKEDASELGNKDIKKIPVTGFACTLIDINWVKEHLSPPYCSLKQDENGSTRTEDICFFGKIKECGGVMYGDPSVKALHGGCREIITDENVEYLRKASEVSRDQIQKFYTTGVW